MKVIKKTALLVTISLIFLSCSSDNLSKQTADAKGFEIIQNELKNKFGNDAYYTKLAITYNKSIGNIITTTVTNKPSSLKMDRWTFSNNNWQQTAEITLELTGNAKDFMFTLNGKINLVKVGELIELSVAKLKKEKGLHKPKLSLATIQFPKNGNSAKTTYLIQLKPENGGTKFKFTYNLEGKLLNFEY